MPEGSKIPMLGLSLVNKQETTTVIALQKKWDNVLKRTKLNPFPLAPADLVKSKKVDTKSYNEGNKAYSEFVAGQILPELIAMLKDAVVDIDPEGMADIQKRIKEKREDDDKEKDISDEDILNEVKRSDFNGPNQARFLGGGLGRDLSGLSEEISTRLNKITVIDVSKEGCDNVEDLCAEKKLNNIDVVQSEVLEFWKAETEGDPEAEDKILFYYAGQFIQVQDEATKDLMLNHLGTFLAKPTNKEKTGFRRKVYLLHLLGEDNPTERAEERRSTLYSMDELRKPLEEGFGGQLNIKVIGKHKYFDHETYSLICVSVPSNG